MKMQKLLIFLCLCVLIHADDQCPSGTKWLQLPDRTWDCLVCNDCPRGMVKVENCSIEHDTKCKACDNHSYYDDKGAMCTSCSGCPQGDFMKSPCSQFLDSVCEPCPNGMFSSTANSSSCTNCTACVGDYSTECNSTHNAVCVQSRREEAGPAGVIVGVVLGVLVVVIIGLVICMYRQQWFCWSQHKESKEGYEASKQEDTEDTGMHSRDHFRSLIPCFRRSGENAESVATELDHVTERKEKSSSKDKHAQKHERPKSAKDDAIKILKEKQMDRENDIKGLKLEEQLKKLSSSVGVIVCTKPIQEKSEEAKLDQQTTHRLAVVFVGSKYIMTVYFALVDLFGTENGALNHSAFEAPGVYVNFDGGENSSNIQYKICASEPPYKNESLDIVILEIKPSFQQTLSASTSNINASTPSMDKNKQQKITWPPSLCLHTSLPFDNVNELHFIVYDIKEKKALQLRNCILKIQKSQGPQDKVPSSLKTARYTLSAGKDDFVKILQDKKKSERLLKYSLDDLDGYDLRKVFWSKNPPPTFPGAPGFIIDKRDDDKRDDTRVGCCRFYCICTGRVPKFMDDLSETEKEKFKDVSQVYTGTMMSALHVDMAKNNSSLADELFSDFIERKENEKMKDDQSEIKPSIVHSTTV